MKPPMNPATSCVPVTQQSHGKQYLLCSAKITNRLHFCDRRMPPFQKQRSSGWSAASVPLVSAETHPMHDGIKRQGQCPFQYRPYAPLSGNDRALARNGSVRGRVRAVHGPGRPFRRPGPSRPAGVWSKVLPTPPHPVRFVRSTLPSVPTFVHRASEAGHGTMGRRSGSRETPSRMAESGAVSENEKARSTKPDPSPVQSRFFSFDRHGQCKV